MTTCGAFDAVGAARSLAAGARRRDRLVHLAERPARLGEPDLWPDWAHPEVVAAFVAAGISQPWHHQREAADLVHNREHTIISTGTASGKSLAYLLPALSAIARSTETPGRRGETVLYLAPTKALARDQLARIESLGLGWLRAAAVDGDTEPEGRDWARDHASYVVTNPDMLHVTLLPTHARWAEFWRALRFVVVDECHHYRGVFGAHVAQIVRRLSRIAAHYGSSPTFVLASATVSEPDVTASRLVGAPVRAVTHDGSPRGRSALALWEPPLTSMTGEHGAPVRRSALTEGADLVADLAVAGVRTLAFVRSRHGAEVLALQVSQRLRDVDATLADRVRPYRGGFLPEDRREIEAALRSGALLVVCTTNALELGVDIGGLDAVVLIGYPGTRASLWQQVGRAGRGATGGLGLMVARDDPLDTYLVTHPAVLLDAPVEASVFDPGNPYVLAPHLCAAAQELPITDEDVTRFDGDVPGVLASLVEDGLLRRRTAGWFWTSRGRASGLADIRSAGGAPVRVVDAETGRVIGTVDHAAADTAVHTGAVHMHLGDTYVVESYRPDEGLALVTRRDVDYSTSARVRTEIAILAEERHRAWGQARLSFGTVEVTSQAVGFLVRRVPSGEVVGELPLDLPARRLRTKAVWWSLTDEAVEQAGVAAAAVPGAVHAAEHASIGLLPLVATCDRWDIGGVSTALHGDTGLATVFVYDGHAGGAGFAERGYAVARAWLTATRDAIVACGCEDGCPSCVQSPKCGNGNLPLDKAGAVAVLGALLG